MKNIGIKTQFVTAKFNSSDMKGDITAFLKTEMQSIKDKASLIIMPVMEKHSGIFESIRQDGGKDILSNIKNIKMLPINKISGNSYDFCLSFGLALNKKLKKINKAYFLALEQSGNMV